MSHWIPLALLCLAVPAFADKRRDPSPGYHNSLDDLTPEELKAVRNFKLTTATTDKLIEASKRLSTLAEKNPGAVNGKEQAKTLDGLVKIIEAHPEVGGALKSAGLSPREFWFGINALGAAILGSFARMGDPKAPLPAYVNPDNVAFLAAHPEVLQKFQESKKKEPPRAKPDSDNQNDDKPDDEGKDK